MITRAKLYAFGEPLGDCVTRKEGRRVICGGGSDSSSASTSSTTSQDNRVALSAAGGGVGINASGSSINVQTLDSAVLSAAGDVLKSSGSVINNATDVLKSGGQTVADSLVRGSDLLTHALESVSDNAQKQYTQSLANERAALQSALDASAAATRNTADGFNTFTRATSDALTQGYNTIGSTQRFSLDVFNKASDILSNNQALTKQTGDILSQAYADAKGQTQDNKYIITAALAVVGVVGFAAMRK